MPHNLYLHSALVQTRIIGEDDASKRNALKWNFWDSTIALNLALFVNAAILILAAAAFHKNGLNEVASIQDAHKLLEPLVGNNLAPALFAIALIAAGQSSTVTGTLAGQIVMEGYLHIRVNPWLRRIITRAVAVIPAFITILLAGEDKMTDLLVLSQVVLSVQLAFAVIPLIYAVSNKQMMKNFTIKPWLLTLSILIASVILYLNIRLVVSKAMDYMSTSENLTAKGFLILGLICFSLLLIATIVYPFFFKRKHNQEETIHQGHRQLQTIEVKDYHRIALALDFSKMDERIISHAIKQSTSDTTLLLIHVVESASAKILGSNTADNETIRDKEQLTLYETKLREMGMKVSIHLGYRNRVDEIARICKEEKADFLILGAHGHSGISDFIYGQTIESVRHKVNIPVLIVS